VESRKGRRGRKGGVKCSGEGGGVREWHWGKWREARLLMWADGLQVGAFEKDPQKIADLLTRWFGNERPAFEEMAQRARQMGVEFKSALFRIVADLADLCNKYAFHPLPEMA
jgi:hypothetical protein